MSTTLISNIQKILKKNGRNMSINKQKFYHLKQIHPSNIVQILNPKIGPSYSCSKQDKLL
jgi:hypothetical protein